MNDDTVETARAAMAEMDFCTVEGQFGNEFDTSFPCQLRFVDEGDQDTAAFHDALQEQGFESLDASPDRRASEADGPHYDGEIVSREDYKRIRVVVYRGDVVRVYPRENQPSTEELAGIIEALEAGFGSELEHDPIERD